MHKYSIALHLDMIVILLLLKISFRENNFIRSNSSRNLNICGKNKIDVSYCLLSNISVFFFKSHFQRKTDSFVHKNLNILLKIVLISLTILTLIILSLYCFISFFFFFFCFKKCPNVINYCIFLFISNYFWFLFHHTLFN